MASYHWSNGSRGKVHPVAVVPTGGFVVLVLSVYADNQGLTSRIVIAVWSLRAIDIFLGEIRRAR